ncbi:MAG: glycoside hydrolase family 3 C-terminal domain-containing protein [Clostridiales bacterium]|nr:glycoside hydrolase family 3 C-terminal domain-containing protein [Clostridiales bacterium]
MNIGNEKVMLNHQSKIDDMTLEEKVSLMSGANFWNTKSVDRLNIPSMMLTDGPHGLRKQGGKSDHLGLNKSMPSTCFPTAATLANSWDVTLLSEVGSCLGKEAKGEDVSVLLGPGLNIKRNPLCGRNFEYFSEDPFLSGKLSAAMIKGIQSEGIAACPKHFAVNSQETRRMIVDEIVDERALHELYLEGFRYAVTEGKAKVIMTAYNKVNGDYANENQYLLNDVLKNSWGFDGLVVTDWGGNNDRVAGLTAGNALEMPSTNGMTDLEILHAIENNVIDESLLDKRVDQVLTVIYDALPYIDKGKSYTEEEHHEKAIEASVRSIVLLKNDNQILPITDTSKKIAVIGDFAKTPRYQGAGSSLIEPTKVDSLLDVLNDGALNIIGYEKGFKRLGGKSKKLKADACQLAKKSDVVLLFLGLDEGSEAEGVDREHMRLSVNQIELVDALSLLGKDIVLILAGGSPVELPFINKVKGILHGYLPGQGGGTALSKILTGERNPSGKLSESYPEFYSDVPSAKYYPGEILTSEHKESIYIGYRYFDTANKTVRFPFGFGLSYTSFEYSQIKIEDRKVYFDIRNTGSVAGEEVVQVYVRSNDSQVFKAKKELKGFSKVKLLPGEKKHVEIDLDDHAFSYYNVVLKKWVEEPGKYDILVGASSRDIKLTQAIVVTGDPVESPYNKNRIQPYFNCSLDNLTSSDFEQLIEKSLPVSSWDKEKKLTKDDIIEQSKYGGWFGKLLYHLILLVRKFYLMRKKPILANNVMFVMEMPFRSVARMSGGLINMNMLDGLLMMVNGQFLKGLKILLKIETRRTMEGKMKSRKQLKLEAKEQFLKDKSKKKSRRIELSKMDADKRSKEKKEDKLERKAQKKDRKSFVKLLPTTQKKEARKYDKYYKKLRKRPRKYAVLGLLLLVVVFVGIKVSPIITDISELMSTELISDTPEAKAALEYGQIVAEEISDEGIVLLKNEDSLLPLLDKQVNVFGYSAHNFRLSGGGSGGADQKRAINFFDGLAMSNIEYNKDLYDFYQQNEDYVTKEGKTGLLQVAKSMLSKGVENEPTIDYLTDDIIKNAQAFSDTAIVVLTSSSVEASDAELEQLRLSDNMKDLLDRVTSNFENVIVIVNAGNTLELGFLDEYPSIKAAVWTGTPGSRGAVSLGKILAGDVNPSGRLTDTYVYDNSTHPSIENFGDYQYDNIDGIGLLEYEEGIYIGYRYYETYYLDNEAEYQKTVQYPFGHGLSYTDFEWELVNSVIDDDMVTVDVKVKNTGDRDGKDVVQVYFSAPYYEGGIEKSSIELGAYAKTSLLKPNESEVLSIAFKTREMSSYDMETLEAFVLEAGNYEIHISKNVHEPMISLNYEVKDTIVYTKDDKTGTPIENQFDYADGNLKYLSRADWENTYPSDEDLSLTATDEFVKDFNRTPEKVEGTLPTTGAENNIVLKDLKGLDYNDPKWDAFLDQFTMEEMNALVNTGAYRTLGFERLGLPDTVLMDGPAGINNFFKETTAASYPTEIVIASTWNDDLAYKMGEAVGMEANAYGVDGWYAPGMNLHRSPKGGRNFEYFSEDPLLSGKMSTGMVSGAQSKDILVFMKHFAMNEQEINARSGVVVFANEQAMRELYLKPFEITVKEAQVTGVMSSFIHIGHKWSGGNPELLQNVLRDEWGFVGVVSTDAVLGDFMDVNLAVRNGNELMLAMIKQGNIKKLDELYQEDPVGITVGARARTHNICYALLEYTNAVK